MKILLQLGGVLLYTAAALFSCTPPTPGKNYTVHYSWQYDCIHNPLPQAFEYGASPDGQQLVMAGMVSVSNCTSQVQQFQVAIPRLKAPPPTGTKFYVRAVFPGNVYSTPDFYVLQ